TTDEPFWATSVRTAPMGALANTLAIVFCAPPTCTSVPPTTVPPKPAGLLRPCGDAKFFIGLLEGFAHWVRGPPLNDRSKLTMARPLLAVSDSSPTIE